MTESTSKQEVMRSEGNIGSNSLSVGSTLVEDECMSPKGIMSSGEEPLYGVCLTMDNPTGSYEFDSLDLAEVFSTFGCCVAVEVSNDGRSATALFSSYQTVLNAVTTLSGLYVPILGAALSVRGFKVENNSFTPDLLTDKGNVLSSLISAPFAELNEVSPNQVAPSSGSLPQSLAAAAKTLPMPSLPQISHLACAKAPENLRPRSQFTRDYENSNTIPTAPVSPVAYNSSLDYSVHGGYATSIDYSKNQSHHHTTHHQERHNQSHTASNARAFERSDVRKWTARYEIQIDAEPSFQVTRRLIGTRGANMKRIFRLTSSKLRLRGRGSGYLEGVNQQEADDPLHLCISSQTESQYQETRKLVESLLHQVYSEYDIYRQTVLQLPPAMLEIKFKETFLPIRQG